MLRPHTVLEGGRVVFEAPVMDPLPDVDVPDWTLVQCEVFNDWVVSNDPAIPLTWRTRGTRVGAMFTRSSSESYPSSPEG